MGSILPLVANRGEGAGLGRTLTKFSSNGAVIPLIGCHRLSGDGIYRVRFSNANGFIDRQSQAASHLAVAATLQS